MREDKKIAIKLRRQGKSYNQISSILKVSKGTLSEWFSGQEWSLKVKQVLQEAHSIRSRDNMKGLHVARQLRLEELYLKADKEAEREFLKYKNNPLFISGVMLYWGEGYKKLKNGQVKISNTDYSILKIFRNFLIRFGNYPMEKIKAWILLYPDLNPENCIDYWATEVGILKSNFIKSTVIEGKHKVNRLSYGTCTLYVSNKYLKRKILLWIDLFKKELVVLK